MWKLSEATHQLLQQLYKRQGNAAWFGRRKRIEDLVTLVQETAEQGEPGAIPAVLRLLFFDSTDVRIAASRALDRLLSSVPPEELLHLSTALEWSWGWYISDAWDQLQPRNLNTLVAEGSTRTAVLGLASFHRNGYVRHDAVRLLAEMRDGRELPYLLIRQNDWVKAISIDAQAAIQERLTIDYLAHFIHCFPLVLHLLAFQRHDLSTVVRRVVEMLVEPAEDERLAEVIRSPKRAVRRPVVRSALDLVGEHRRRVIEHGLCSEDAVLRLWCAWQVRASFSGEELSRVLKRLKQDRSMPVRRAALLTEVDAFPDSARDIWQQALLDPHVSIRELARIRTAAAGGPDPAEFYRRTLGQQPDSLPALSGLGETGTRSDLAVIRAYLRFPVPNRRRAAIRGLATIGKESVVEELIECLRDDSTAVVREVRQQLHPFLYAVQGDRLLAIISQDQRRHVREGALQVTSEMGKWRSLPWLIRASAHKDRHTAESAQRMIAAWFSPPRCNKVFTRPSASESNAIDEAMAESRPAMPKKFRRMLEDWLR